MTSISSFVSEQVVTRANSLIAIPITLLYYPIDTALGCLGGLAAIFSGGIYKNTVDFAAKHLSSSKHIMAVPYERLITAINPKAQILPQDLLCSAKIISSISGKINSQAHAYSNSANFLERHVYSRLCYALLGVTLTVDAIANALLSVPITALSILTLGKVEWLNSLARYTLESPGIIGELFFCTLKVVNPQCNTALLFW